MIKVGFIALTIIMAALVYLGFTTALRKTQLTALAQSKFSKSVLSILAIWLAYVAIASLTGVFKTASLPPRIPFMLVLPCFLFMGWFFRSGRFTDIIDAVPLSWVTYTQSFRVVVEIFLHALALQGLLPMMGTFEGYNYEIVIGTTALLVGYFGATNKTLPRAVLLSWNYAGLVTLAIVVFIFLSHAYAPGIYDHPGQMSVKDFGSFPFTLLAGFLMPLAVFMHVFSLVKLRRSK